MINKTLTQVSAAMLQLIRLYDEQSKNISEAIRPIL